MALILTKKSDTSSSVPLAADLTNAAGGAELAVNTADKRLYSKTSGGAVVELGTNPSSMTLPNGTANGVPYLNGSKVLTSGSALTFDGTNFGVGAGTALAKLHVSANTGTAADFSGSVRVTNQSYTAGTYAGVLFETADTLNSYITGIRQGSYAGQLAFGVNTGGSGTSLSEQMRLTSTGLGIGTSSPEQRLHVSNTGSTGVSIKFTNSVASAGILSYSSDSFLFYTGNTVRATLDSSGNLGLGVTPSAWATAKAIQVGLYGSISSLNNSTYIGQNFYYNAGFLYQNATSRYACLYEQNQFNGVHAWYTAPSGTAGNAIPFTQAMTLDASGNLLVGTTSTNGVGWTLSPSGSGQIRSSGTSSQDKIQFANSNGVVGAITTNGSSTSYFTSSDYRLKENIQPMAGALAKVAALKPVTYTWKADGSAGEGFIAHELAEICPAAVTGEKDAVDKDGKPQYQGIDVSFLVGTLTAAIQEQQAIIEGMKTRLAALESK